MKTLNIILLAFTCSISSQLIGQNYTLNQLIGSWDFVTIGGQAAPAGAQLVLSENDKGILSLGSGPEEINYKLDNGILYINSATIGNVAMEILSCRDKVLNLKDKKDGALLELQKLDISPESIETTRINDWMINNSNHRISIDNDKP